MTTSLDRIDHTHLYVADREVLEQWYAKVLGVSWMPEPESWAINDGPDTVSNEVGTVHLALLERKPQLSHSWLVCIKSYINSKLFI